MTSIPEAMTPALALSLIEAQPLTATYGLKAGEAELAVAEYQRFLALALSSGESAATMPSPLVQAIWDTHNPDPVYAAFLAALGPTDLTLKLTRHRSSRHQADDPAYKATRARYRATFGDITPQWWPSPIWLGLKNHPGALSFLAFGLFYSFIPKPSPDARLIMTTVAGVFMLFHSIGSNRFTRMTAPRASYAATPKARR